MHILSQHIYPTTDVQRWLGFVSNKDAIQHDFSGVIQLQTKQGFYIRMLPDFDKKGETIVIHTSDSMYFGTGPAGAPDLQARDLTRQPAMA